MIKGGAIAIAFDDANSSDMTVGMQALLDRGLEPKGTSYIPGSYVGKTNRLTIENIVQMLSLGWDIQCHSYYHTIGGVNGGMTSMTAQELMDDMQLQDNFFENEIGIPAPRHHAYPGGASSQMMHNIMGRYRDSFRTTQAQFFSKGVDKYRIPAFSFEGTTIEKIEEYKKIIDYVMANDLPIIVFLHDLYDEDKINAYGQILDYIKSKNTKLVTVSELYEKIWENN